MRYDLENPPIVHFKAEPTPAQRAEMRAQVRWVLLPAPPVPVETRRLLHDTACADTGEMIVNIYLGGLGLTGLDGQVAP